MTERYEPDTLVKIISPESTSIYGQVGKIIEYLDNNIYLVYIETDNHGYKLGNVKVHAFSMKKESS